MSDWRIGGWIQTATGRQFWPLDPRPEDVCLEDIAHALAHQCRFAGHVRRFYSVCEHSLFVSRILPDADALWGLMHDASEAYLVDVPRPIKHELDRYLALEKDVQQTICHRYGLPSRMPETVQIADDVMLATEKRDLLLGSPSNWPMLPEPCTWHIPEEAPSHADLKRAFMDQFKLLGGVE